MDIRNVQKTGNMYYVYLPTLWCKSNSIKPASKVSLMPNNDGSLTISPQIAERKLKSLNIELAEDSQSIINKLLVASYINPTSSFKISLTKPVNIEKLITQKKLISIEMVEFDGKHISCESSVVVENPILLLRTMARKVKNMVCVMRTNYDQQLADRYEEEIDRSKLLIEKSVIHRLTFNEPSSIKNIYMHYAALISKDLEKAVDQLLILGKTEKSFLEMIEKCITNLLDIFDKIASLNHTNISYKDVILFSKNVDSIRLEPIKGPKSYSKLITKQMLENISEVLFDWSVTYMVEDKPDKQVSVHLD